MAVKKRGRERGREKEEEGDPLELKLYYRDPWTIKKKLTESDLNHLSRLIIPTDQVEKHVMPALNPDEYHAVLWSERGLLVNVKDLDEGTCHRLTFKKLESSRSYKFGLNWISQFVKRRRLQRNDMIGMFWDDFSKCFCFSVVQRYRPDAAAEPVVASTPLLDPSLCEFARKHLRLSPPLDRSLCKFARKHLRLGLPIPEP